MQDLTTSSCGFDGLVIKGCPSSNKEYKEASGRDAFNDALEHYKAHNHLSKFRAQLAAKLAEATGLEQIKTKDGDKDVLEAVTPYLNRLKAHLADNGQSLSDYQHVAQELMDSIPVNLKPAPRTGGSGKPAKMYMDKASEIRGNGKLVGFLENNGVEVNTVLGEDGEFIEGGHRVAANAVKVKYLAVQKAAREQEDAIYGI